MQSDAVPVPFRFRPPKGWPSPSPEWVALHQLAEPPTGWTPGPGLLPAPPSWTFWRPVRRDVRRFLPAGWLAARIRAVVGLLLVIAGFGATFGLAIAGEPAALGLVPLVVGAALYVLAQVRSTQLVNDAVRAFGEQSLVHRASAVSAAARAAHPELPEADAVAVWNAEAWGIPEAYPFVATVPSSFDRRVRRGGRFAVTLSAVVVALVAVVAIVAASIPAVDAVSATVLGSSLGDGGFDDYDSWTPAPYTSDDGAVEVTAYSDDSDAWDATCGASFGDEYCWAYAVKSTQTCDARVVIGFGNEEDGSDEVRSSTRVVHLTAGRVLVVAEPGDEAYSGVDSVACGAAAPAALDVDVTAAETEAGDAVWTGGCDDTGCATFTIDSRQECGDATVQLEVHGAYGKLKDPHDLVVSVPLHVGAPQPVFAGGVDDDRSAKVTAVTCTAGGDTPETGSGDAGA